MKHSQMHPNTTRGTKTWVYGPIGWIGSVHCKKFWCDFMARTCALIAPVQPVFTEFRVVMKYCRIHPNTTRRTQTWVHGPTVWIGCVRCEKIQNDFMAQTCALIASVQPILQRVSCSNETLPSAPKHYETHQNMSLGSNGVDRVHSFGISDATSWHELLH